VKLFFSTAAVRVIRYVAVGLFVSLIVPTRNEGAVLATAVTTPIRMLEAKPSAKPSSITLSSRQGPFPAFLLDYGL